MDYFLARHYSSAQGRFTSPDEFAGGPDEFWVLGSEDGEKQALPYADILNPQSLNKYQSGFNNPIRYVDPDGHQTGKDPLTRFLEYVGLYTAAPHPNAGKQAILDQRIPGHNGMTVGDMYGIARGATEEAGKALGTVLGTLDPTGMVGAVQGGVKNIGAEALERLAVRQLEKRFPVITLGRQLTKTGVMADIIAISRSGNKAVVEEVSTGVSKSLSKIRGQLAAGFLNKKQQKEGSGLTLLIFRL